MKSVCVCVILAAVFTSSAAETDEHFSLLQKSAVVDMRSAKQQSSEDETMEEYALEDAGDENENDALDESEGGKKCKKWCYSDKVAQKKWKNRCNWRRCAACPQCD